MEWKNYSTHSYKRHYVEVRRKRTDCSILIKTKLFKIFYYKFLISDLLSVSALLELLHDNRQMDIRDKGRYFFSLFVAKTRKLYMQTGPISAGNTFQELPRSRETTDNTEYYISM